MTLDLTFREFADALNARSVRYLVVGGYAVAFHGHPRYTKDLDVWIDPEPGNVARLLLALEDFGFGSLGLDLQDFADPEFLIQLGRPPLRIDLLTDLPGIIFSAAYLVREMLDAEGSEVPFIDLENLLASKRKTGRPQDVEDVRRLSGSRP